jgi:hypothetical protein
MDVRKACIGAVATDLEGIAAAEFKRRCQAVLWVVGGREGPEALTAVAVKGDLICGSIKLEPAQAIGIYEA